MDKIWLKSYPPGVPAEIDPDRYSSIIELFSEACEAHPEQTSFYNLGVGLSYSELNKLSVDFAAFLQQELKLEKGERLALMLPNVLQYPVALFGALRAGLIVVNVNPLYTAQELIHQLADADVKTIIVLENFANTVEAALPHTPLKNIIIAKLSDFLSPLKAFGLNLLLKFGKKIPPYQLTGALAFRELMAKAKKLSFTAVQLHLEDVAFLQYTGGTTGVSKGAMLTHRNIIANIEQAYAWFKPQFHPGNEIVFTALPLYHIFSLLVNCLLYVTKVGGTNVLITNPRNVKSMLKAIKAFRFTCITGVNTLFNVLLNQPEFCKQNFSQLRLSVGGGAAVQHAVADHWQEVTGCVLLEGYGLTECSPCVAVNPPDLKQYSGSIGLPLPSTEIALLDDEGNEVLPGQVGELAVKGPQVMKGYWRQSGETQKTFSRDGWLLTGDIASIDERGFLRILERKKDMVLVSGFNVYPSEVEDVIAAIPGVREVVVVGVRDEATGEAVKAFVVRNNPTLTSEEVIRLCHQSLTPYKVPKMVQFCEDLPKSNVGKILRRELRDKV